MYRAILSVICALTFSHCVAFSPAAAYDASPTATASEKKPGEKAEQRPETAALSERNGKAPDDATTKTSQPQRHTYTVTPKQLKVQDRVDGFFVADKMFEITLQPEEWSTFKIEDIVEHGAKVQESETLLKFESKELLDAIADLEIDLHSSELRLDRSEQELPRKRRTIERQLSDAEENVRRSEEDYKRYKETERQQAIDSAEMNLKMAKFYLDYYKDELEQLEKMYEADDLTEETEEIVLRRQRTYVEFAEFDYKMSKYRRDRTVNIFIPRRDRDMEESVESSKELLVEAQTASDVDVNLARYELEKAKSERQKSLEKQVKLLADKSLLTVKSPAAGVVYYGECVDGKWNKLDSMREKLVPGKTADKESVLMTVVDASSQYFLVKLDEKYLISLKQGQDVKVQPAVEGSAAIEGTIAYISKMPVADGKFEVRIEFSGDLPDWLVPGISGTVKLISYQQDEALVAPEDAVHKDELTDEEYVWVVAGDGVHKTPVETGKKKGKQIEITVGLSAGDVLSLDDEEKEAE